METYREPWRFWSKVKEVESGCWEWQGYIATNGYGQSWNPLIGYGPTKTTAHRISWWLTHGPFEDGLQLDHLCLNKRCVNPDHLEPVTAKENMRRSHAKTHCKRGHEMVGEPGKRTCKPCALIHQQAWRDRQPKKPKQNWHRSRYET